MEPILAIRLGDFNLTTIQIGIIFAIMPFFYTLVCVLYSYVPQCIEKRLLMMMTALLSFPTNLLTGPSDLFYFPNSLSLMVLG
jgi:hypothetical protein